MSDDARPGRDPRDEIGYERAFAHGSRTAWAMMLLECLRQLGYDDPGAVRHQWVAEREQAVLALRSVCERFGDNDWEPTLNLADVISKHLHDHLAARKS